MQVTVRLMGPYRRAAGVTDDVILSLAEPTLGGVLAALRAEYPDAGRKLEPAPGKIEPAVRVILNDVVLEAATIAHSVRDGDRLAFVPIVGGGSCADGDGARAQRHPRKRSGLDARDREAEALSTLPRSPSVMA